MNTLIMWIMYGTKMMNMWIWFVTNLTTDLFIRGTKTKHFFVVCFTRSYFAATKNVRWKYVLTFYKKSKRTTASTNYY